MDSVKVMLLHEEELVRKGLRASLIRADGVEVASEVGDRDQALNKAQQVLPDVILTTSELPLRTGIEIAQVLRERSVPSAVVVLGPLSQQMAADLDAGAIGDAQLDSLAKELANAIRQVPARGFMALASIWEADSESTTDAPQTASTEIELVLAGPVSPVAVIGLSKWLWDVAKVDVKETMVAYLEGVLIRFTLPVSFDLPEAIANLPEVAEVIEEPYEGEGRDDSLDERNVGGKRYRLFTMSE